MQIKRSGKQSDDKMRNGCDASSPVTVGGGRRGAGATSSCEVLLNYANEAHGAQ